jgi:hypothetical protein
MGPILTIDKIDSICYNIRSEELVALKIFSTKALWAEEK